MEKILVEEKDCLILTPLLNHSFKLIKTDLQSVRGSFEEDIIVSYLHEITGTYNFYLYRFSMAIEYIFGRTSSYCIEIC